MIFVLSLAIVSGISVSDSSACRRKGGREGGKEGGKERTEGECKRKGGCSRNKIKYVLPLPSHYNPVSTVETNDDAKNKTINERERAEGGRERAEGQRESGGRERVVEKDGLPALPHQ